MPTGNRHQIQWVQGGDWNARNEVYDAQKHASQLMQKATIDDTDYITVQLDSGATSAVPAGAQAAMDVAYFKDRRVGLVTHDARVAEKGIDSVAGIFPATVTPGRITALKTGRSRNVSMTVDGSTFAAGDLVISDSAANGPQGTRVAAGTAAAQGRFIGQARGAAVANVLAVDLELPDFD
jgi:hypothetical protein